MTRKNATKVSARARQARFDGKYRHHRRHVEAQENSAAPPPGELQTICASCAPSYGYEPGQAQGQSWGGQCFGCRTHHELLGMFKVPNPAGGFPWKPLTRAELAKRRIVPEEDSYGAFDGEDDE